MKKENFDLATKNRNDLIILNVRSEKLNKLKVLNETRYKDGLTVRFMQDKHNSGTEINAIFLNPCDLLDLEISKTKKEIKRLYKEFENL